MKLWFLFGFSLLAFCAVIVVACNKTIPENKQIKNSSVVKPELEENRRLWNEKNIVNYNITVSASQGGNISYPSPALIEVRDNQAISISVDSKSDEKLRERYKEIDTVNKMFEIIERGFEKEAKVEVKYNQEFGYPEKLIVQDMKRGIDSWIIVNIGKFEVYK